MKYCFIGERELVLAFALVGVDGIIANTPEESRDAFFRVTGRGNMLAGGTPSLEERPRILILTEDVSLMLGEEVSNWQMGTEYPLIVEIPGLHGHLPDRKSLTEAIRDAIGIHV